uniref:Uncharacterized protein n=1 Tax=Nelumbo nucifera TaxID=4432 RepID=A0A822XRW0_NELNU|nr:TPA_asm: hypothetical protein HUJ06_022988 [Nelumbo nucifera]
MQGEKQMCENRWKGLVPQVSFAQGVFFFAVVIIFFLFVVLFDVMSHFDQQRPKPGIVQPFRKAAGEEAKEEAGYRDKWAPTASQVHPLSCSEDPRVENRSAGGQDPM